MIDLYKKIEDVTIEGKTVLVRTDFDVELEDEVILDNQKIKACLKTIEYLISKNCKVVIISHLGNPEGITNDKLSLMPVRFELGKLLNVPIKFAHIDACENSIKFMEKGEVLLLENLKFKKEELEGTREERLSIYNKMKSLIDVYILESFGVEDSLTSVDLLPKELNTYLGYYFIDEISNLSKLNRDSEQPIVAILGGNDFENKMGSASHFATFADTLILGGELAYTFLKALGTDIGDSAYGEKFIKDAKSIISLAKDHGCEILYPVDHICSDTNDELSIIEVDTQSIKKGLIAKDIGKQTLVTFREAIESAKTIFWDGRMGEFRTEAFSRGTEAVGEYIALSSPRDAFKIVNGSDTSLAIEVLKIKAKRFTHISTGSDKTITFLSKQTLKQLEAVSL